MQKNHGNYQNISLHQAHILENTEKEPMKPIQINFLQSNTYKRDYPNSSEDLSHFKQNSQSKTNHPNTIFWSLSNTSK